jgi:hypothetical protein
MQNFVGTLLVDSIGVAMAAFGCLNPLLAAFIHVSSELVFLNFRAASAVRVPCESLRRFVLSASSVRPPRSKVALAEVARHLVKHRDQAPR